MADMPALAGLADVRVSCSWRERQEHHTGQLHDLAHGQYDSTSLKLAGMACLWLRSNMHVQIACCHKQMHPLLPVPQGSELPAAAAAAGGGARAGRQKLFGARKRQPGRLLELRQRLAELPAPAYNTGWPKATARHRFCNS